MSILIKGIKMPRACQVCPLGHWNKLDKLTGCEIVRRYVPKDDIEFWEKDKPSWCPLVEVPTPHGRLKDEQELIKAINEKVDNVSENRGRGATIPSIAWFSGVSSALSIIEAAPVIIEAEEGEEK